MGKLLAKAISITSKAFENVVDRGGHPYMLHCFRVWNGVKDQDEVTQICAIMHDLVEDCEEAGYDFDFIREQGFPEEVITVLKLLTHDKKNMSYDDYIKGVSTNSKAIKVKMSDIEDNMDIKRLKGLRKKDFDRLQKYATAYTYLKN